MQQMHGAQDCTLPRRRLAPGAQQESRRDPLHRHFWHSRLTHLGQVTSNLSGVIYLAGHKQPATTARHMRPQKAADEDVLQAAAAAGQPEFSLHSGCGATAAKRHPVALARKQKPRTSPKDSGFFSCEEGDLNPHGC